MVCDLASRSVVGLAVVLAAGACRSETHSQTAEEQAVNERRRNADGMGEILPVPLICRGGKLQVNTELTFHMWSGSTTYFNGVEVKELNSNYTIEVQFERADAAAGDSGAKLQPGTCAFRDRVLSATEPTAFRILQRTPVPIRCRWSTKDGVVGAPEVGSLFDDMALDPKRVVSFDIAADKGIFTVIAFRAL
jgi:hypothetical protein